MQRVVHSQQPEICFLEFEMLHRYQKTCLCIALAFLSQSVLAQKNTERDQFFWLGQINKATAVINTDEGLSDRDKAPKIAAGLV